MALRNLFNQNSNAFSMEDIEITHAMTLKEDNFTIKHELNPSTGTYSVKNKLGNKVMEFDNNNLLKPSALHSHIQNLNTTTNDRIDAHNTRITAVEGVLDPMTYINATTSGTSYNVVSVPIATNKRGYFEGKIYFENGFIDFIVYCQNVSGTVSIQSWNLDFNYITDNRSIEFQVSSTNIIIKIINISSAFSFRLGYDTDFMNI